MTILRANALLFFALIGVSVGAALASADDGWILQRQTDRLTDQNYLEVVRRSKRPISDRITTGYSVLRVQCEKQESRPGHATVSVHFPISIKTSYGDFGARFDQDKPFTLSGFLGENPKSLLVTSAKEGLGSSGAAKPFAGMTTFYKALEVKSNLMIRIETVFDGDFDVDFDLTGLKQAMTPLIAECRLQDSPKSGAKPQSQPKKDVAKAPPSKPKRDDYIASILHDGPQSDPISVVKQQVSKCFTAGDRARDVKGPIVIRATVAPDGTVTSAVIEDRSRMNDLSYRAAAESAQRAMLNPQCQPLKLPSQTYEQWKNLRVDLNPRDLPH